MNTHIYSPEKALNTLMKIIREQDEILADHVQKAIDAGKDLTKTEHISDRRKKPRVYRKTVPFTHEEALQIALEVLQAYFIEQPLFLNSLNENLRKVNVSELPAFKSSPEYDIKKLDRDHLDSQGDYKIVEIELQTETQIFKADQETMPLKRIDKSKIDKQRRNLKELKALINFGGD